MSGSVLEALLGERSTASVAELLAGALVVLLWAVSPPRERPRVAVPLLLMLAALAPLALSFLLPSSLGVARPLALLALLLLLMSMGRTVFLLLVDALLARRLTQPLPAIYRDILQGVIYVGALLLFLRALGVEPGSLLTTSALLTAVIGLALQDTLGNLIAGLAIHAQRIVDVGDWIEFETDKRLVGCVTEVNWRATKMLTVDHVEVVIPNALVAKTPVRNFTRPTNVSRRHVRVSCSYDVPPERVRAAILGAIEGAPGVLADPPPAVRAAELADSGMTYEVYFFIDTFPEHTAIDSLVRERIWYALRRARIAIPFPTRDVHVHTEEDRRRREEEAQRAAVEAALRSVPIFASLDPPSLARLASATTCRLFGDHEIVIRQGDAGDELFLVHRGQVSVRVGRAGGSIAEIARLSPGAFFGEMSLLTGEPRRATVASLGDCELYVVSREALAPILASSPGLVDAMGEALAERAAELDQSLAAREQRAAQKIRTPQADAALLAKIRAFFSL